jgi:hypothetical protein
MFLLKKNSVGTRWKERHGDGVIRDYRETSVSSRSSIESSPILHAVFNERVLPYIEEVAGRPVRPKDLLPAHVLHLSKNGGIDFHKDNVRFDI